MNLSWHSILSDSGVEDYIMYGLKHAIDVFESVDISLNGEGKNVVFTTGDPRYQYKTKYYKEQIVENGLQYTVYTTDEFSSVITKYYTYNGLLHREKGPAYIEKFINTCDETVAYLKNGKLHRKNGPAVILKEDSEIEIRYWISGKYISPTVAERKQKLKKLKKLYDK